jgi:hypothetical protein
MCDMKIGAFWDVTPCSLFGVDRRFRGAYNLHYRPDEEAVRTSETSVYSKETTGRYIQEDSNLHTRCRENLKSYVCNIFKVQKCCNLCLWVLYDSRCKKRLLQPYPVDLCMVKYGVLFEVRTELLNII